MPIRKYFENYHQDAIDYMHIRGVLTGQPGVGECACVAILSQGLLGTKGRAYDALRRRLGKTTQVMRYLERPHFCPFIPSGIGPTESRAALCTSD